jgi:hypothetical protein
MKYHFTAGGELALLPIDPFGNMVSSPFTCLDPSTCCLITTDSTTNQAGDNQVVYLKTLALYSKTFFIRFLDGVF